MTDRAHLADVEAEVLKVLNKHCAMTPNDLVAAVRESDLFPQGIPAQEIIQAMWRLCGRGLVTFHTQRGIALTPEGVMQ